MEKAIEALRNGGIILYPTDTTWALGCNATDNDACYKLKALSGNSRGMVMLADGFPMIERYVPEFLEVCYDLVDFATKPLTIIYPNATELSPSVVGNDSSAGFRIVTDSMCLKLIRSIRKPLVATTIPKENGTIARRFEDIPEAIINSVDAIVEQRHDDKMQPLSQIIKIALNNDVKVIRK
jgi:L-threonylcarbamoyladenylate synthase